MPLPGSPRRLLSSLCIAALSLTAASVVMLAAPQGAAAATASRAQVLASAYDYGRSRGYHVGIAVLDTRTGRTYHAGDHAGTFASESVVKVMIATRVYLQGRLHGATARRMYTMITQSDDRIASSTYGSVGGDGLITYIKKHFHLANLGSPPRRAGWWGNTHITPDGMVALYGKLKKMPTFGRWLLNTMHHATKHGSDGFYQWFGLKSANSHAAIKQGWGFDYDNWGAAADENTTGYVNGDRYAVAILARGPSRTYGAAIGAMLTAAARRLLPGGVFPSDAPVVSTLSATTGRTAGGVRIAVHGRNFGGATAVYFNGTAGRSLKRLSAWTVTVLVPAHSAGGTRVRVTTPLGRSSAAGPAYTYYAPPSLTSVTPTTSPSGSTTVTLSGANFVGPRFTVTFNGGSPVIVPATSSTRVLRVTAPKATPGRVVTVRLTGSYGASNVRSFTYPQPAG